MKRFKLWHKLIAFVIIGAVTSSLLGLLYVQRTQSLYEQLVYQEASDKLYLYSERIEEKLREIDKLTVTIASDPDIQEGLFRLKNDTDSGTYDTFLAVSRLKQKLLSYPFHEYSISSIAIVDANGNEYLAGSLANTPVPAHTDEMISVAADRAGASVWTGGGGEQAKILSLRQIRATKHMDLQQLGTLVIRANADEIVNRSDRKSTSYDTSLIIQDGEEPIFPDEERIAATGLPKRDYSAEGMANRYGKLRAGDRNYLAAYFTMSYTGWTFIHLVPYESVFAQAVYMKKILLILYGCILLALIVFGLSFSRGITRPLEELTRRMTQVERGDFATRRSETMKNVDEIGLLTINFAKMTNRLDLLIKENYIKQIHLKESQYEALKAKLNPHFLYNTLDSINWLARRKGQQDISHMVKALGDMLRGTIGGEEMVTVKDEITLLYNYLSIQQFRFEDRLRYRIDIPPKLQDLRLPSMLLQPLVENAVKYGVDEETGICDISVSGEQFGDRLDLWIADHGPGMNPDYLADAESEPGSARPQGSGIGLRSVHNRIQLLFGEEYGISIHNGIDEGTIVRVSVPVRNEQQTMRTNAR